MLRRMRDLRSLETFVWIARLGGFRAAAAKLNTSQPAISARIDQLEQDLGVALFQPPRRLALTAEGVTLLRYAERMLELRGEMLRAVANPGSLEGVLRIGMSETLVHTVLPTLVERLSAAHPQVVLDIGVDITPALKEQLLGGVLDMSMSVGALEDPRVVDQPLCKLGLIWVARGDIDLPDRPVRLAELGRWPVLSFSLNSPVTVVLKQRLAAAGGSGVRLWGSASLTTMVRMVLDGRAISVMPPQMVRAELADGRLRRLRVQDVRLPSVGFHVAYLRKPDAYLSAITAALAQEVARSLPEESDEED